MSHSRLVTAVNAYGQSRRSIPSGTPVFVDPTKEPGDNNNIEVYTNFKSQTGKKTTLKGKRFVGVTSHNVSATESVFSVLVKGTTRVELYPGAKTAPYDHVKPVLTNSGKVVFQKHDPTDLGIFTDPSSNASQGLATIVDEVIEQTALELGAANNLNNAIKNSIRNKLNGVLKASTKTKLGRNATNGRFVKSAGAAKLILKAIKENEDKAVGYIVKHNRDKKGYAEVMFTKQ